MSWKGLKPSAFVNVVEADLKDKRNEIAAEALQMVVTTSPVDTGAFRSSNVVSIDKEDYSIPEIVSAQKTIKAGLAVIAKADQPYQAVIVQSNIRHGEILEDGHSQQAPDGIYRPTMAHIRAKHSKS